jgi:hypothetical protein
MLPMSAPDPNLELVPVFRTSDEALIALAKSLLEAEGIEFVARADGLQHLFGWGQFGIGFNPIVGPVEFVVRREDEARALELFRDLGETQL